jgi:hypothetical protein
VTEESRLDVLLGQRLLQERIVVEIDLANRQVVCRPPVRVDLGQLVATERPVLNRQASGAARAARSTSTNFLSFGCHDFDAPFTGRAHFAHCGGFSICFHIFYLSHVFDEKRVAHSWCRLMDKRTNRCVSRMMVKSSRVAMTRIPAVEALR